MNHLYRTPGPRAAMSRAALLALAAVCLPPAHAATRSWICGEGLFEDASCWLPLGVPGAADEAFVTPDQGVVVFSAQSGTRSLRNLKIDPPASSSSSTFAAFIQNGGSLTTGSIELGPTGSAEFLQYGGTLSTSTLRIQGSARASRYELGGGTLGVATNVVLGGGSAASPSDYLNMSSFWHKGGRATIQDLRVGSGGTGVYRMPDVQFQTAELIAPLMTVGVDAQGTFLQSGVNTRVTANTLVVGGIGSGRYEMSAGVLATTSVDVGTAGHGVFQHSGGTPVSGMRPKVALRPTTPHKPAGIRIEPPPSAPMLMGHKPAATVAAEALDEPPVMWPRFQGLRAGP